MDNPKQSPTYEELVPWAFRIPFHDDRSQKPCVIRRDDAMFLSFATEPGNRVPTWIYLSTPALTAGVFEVPPLGWYDPSNHPEVELYYILGGTLHFGNPDTGGLVELSQGDVAVIPPHGYHWGHNFSTETATILWWVPGGMHPDDLIARLMASGGDWTQWYQREPVVLGGPHAENEGFRSQLPSARAWPPRAGTPSTADDADVVALRRGDWLHTLQGTESSGRVLTSFFYGDEKFQCGESYLPPSREAQPETTADSRLLYVASEEFIVNLGSGESLYGRSGDMIFLPANTEHSYQASSAPGRVFFANAR